MLGYKGEQFNRRDLSPSVSRHRLRGGDRLLAYRAYRRVADYILKAGRPRGDSTRPLVDQSGAALDALVSSQSLACLAAASHPAAGDDQRGPRDRGRHKFRKAEQIKRSTPAARAQEPSTQI